MLSDIFAGLIIFIFSDTPLRVVSLHYCHAAATPFSCHIA